MTIHEGNDMHDLRSVHTGAQRTADAFIRRLTMGIAALAVVFFIVGALPDRSDASVVPISRVQNVSEQQALAECELREAISRTLWHCETWFGGDCVRISLVKPNLVACNPDFVLDKWDGRTSKACHRIALYTSAGGRGKPRITYRKAGVPKKYRTTGWKCITTGPGAPTAVRAVVY